MVVRQGDAQAKKWVMGCASLDRQWWRSEGMRQPNEATLCLPAANAPANKETKSAENAPAKWSNTKSVAARRGMHRPNGITPNRRSAGHAPAKQNNTKSNVLGACWGTEELGWKRGSRI
jgi:hypothetical protein